jgi:hypothetical protein
VFLLTLLVWEIMQRNQNKRYNHALVIKPDIFWFSKMIFYG